MSRPAVPPDFEALYQGHDDPWGTATSWYERRKRAVLLASLPRERYATAWEPGCGPGMTTEALAERAVDLLATDGSPTAVRLARARCARFDGVRVERSALPERPVPAPVHLVVAAELLYYLAEFDASVDALWSACAPGGHLAVLHWAHRPHDGYLSGPEVHDALARCARDLGALSLVRHQDRDFLLDVYEVAP